MSPGSGFARRYSAGEIPQSGGLQHACVRGRELGDALFLEAPERARQHLGGGPDLRRDEVPGIAKGNGRPDLDLALRATEEEDGQALLDPTLGEVLELRRQPARPLCHRGQKRERQLRGVAEQRDETIPRQAPEPDVLDGQGRRRVRGLPEERGLGEGLSLLHEVEKQFFTGRRGAHELHPADQDCVHRRRRIPFAKEGFSASGPPHVPRIQDLTACGIVEVRKQGNAGEDGSVEHGAGNLPPTDASVADTVASLRLPPRDVPVTKPPHPAPRRKDPPMRILLAPLLLATALWFADPAAAVEIPSSRGAPAGFDDVVARLPPYVPSRRFAPKRKDWRFYIAPYGWLAGVSGDVVTAGETTSIDVPFEEIVDRVQGGFQLYAEVRWRRLFVAFDGTWATLQDEVPGRLLTTRVDIDQQIYDLRAGYEVLRRSLDGCLDPCQERWRRFVVADLFVGVRYWRTDVTLTFTGPLDRSRDVSTRSERWDPFVGGRVGWNITRRFSFGLRGDVGGFGIGDAAQFTWQAQASFGYNLTPHIALLLGYRWIGYDTVTGSGTEREGQDLLQQGPVIGVGFSF